MVNPQMMMQFKQFMNDPMGMLSKMGVPSGMRNPQDIIQHLMDTGRLTQDQYAQLQSQAKQFQAMLK